ncbi:hypothetical protein PFTANZ_06034, partial [Plasmodium falciparum Tanzania (2000708)]
MARSFADIGDIVRGRDLYRGGNNKRRQQLDENLQKIFTQIYNDVTSGKNVDKAKERYKDTKNYFQLREDWWDANRSTVWEAITCNAQGNTYFRATCNSGDNRGGAQANHYCRCDDGKKTGKSETDQVPTYFDYVPQYLRWFEEWAEDFCRKRKKKIENAIKNCRGEKGKERYCS